MEPTYAFRLYSVDRNFRVKCTESFTLDCYAHQLLSTDKDRQSGATAVQFSYAGREDQSEGLFSWVRRIIEGTLSA